MKKKVTAIIQARVGSTRLNGKVLINIKGKTILNHVIERISQCNNINDILIATTVLERDNLIVNEAEKIGCRYYRGSEQNVLDRYYEAATLNKSDIIIRITSDCPLIDPKIIDCMIEFYKDNSYNMITNSPPDNRERTYPRGMDTEIFSYDILKEARNNATKLYQLEHVTPYIYENINNIFYYKNEIDYSIYRLTLDTKEDLKLIQEIYNRLYFGNHNFYLNEIIKLMEENPSLVLINNKIIQKKVKE